MCRGILWRPIIFDLSAGALARSKPAGDRAIAGLPLKSTGRLDF